MAGRDPMGGSPPPRLPASCVTTATTHTTRVNASYQTRTPRPKPCPTHAFSPNVTVLCGTTPLKGHCNLAPEDDPASFYPRPDITDKCCACFGWPRLNKAAGLTDRPTHTLRPGPNFICRHKLIHHGPADTTRNHQNPRGRTQHEHCRSTNDSSENKPSTNSQPNPQANDLHTHRHHISRNRAQFVRSSCLKCTFQEQFNSPSDRYHALSEAQTVTKAPSPRIW
jgi:hypothetical protein